MILVSADWQLCDNPRDAYRHAFQKQLRALVKKHDVRCVLVLGDVTEEKDHHGATLVNQIVDHFDKLRGLCRVIVVRGNHDYVDADTAFYQFLRHMNGITWINEPLYDPLHHLPIELADLGDVALLPHTTNYKKDWAGIKLKSFDWVFTHNTFQNANAGQGFQLRGIPPTIFRLGTHVVSGDIHIPQVVQDTVTYVGSPYLCDFGDRYEPRVLLIDKGRMKSIPVTGPQKRLVEITSLAELGDGRVVKRISQGDILKVRMLIDGNNKAKWSELKGKIREWGEAGGYQIHVVQPVLLETIRGHPEAKRTKRRQQSDEDILRTYGKQRGLDDLTMKTGRILMRKI